MNVTLTDQLRSCTTPASPPPANSGNFGRMKTTATNAEPETPSTPRPAPKQIRLRDRIIHPFKVALNLTGLSAVVSGIVGCVPGIAVFGSVGIATSLSCGTVGCALGGLVKLGKMMAGSRSEAVGKGLYLGGVIGGIIAIPPALITATAVSLAAFSVFAPVSTILSIPRSIHRAVTYTDAQMNDWDHKVRKDWQTIMKELKRIPQGAQKGTDAVKSKLS